MFSSKRQWFGLLATVLLGAGCAMPVRMDGPLADESADLADAVPTAEPLDPVADDLASDLTDRRVGSRIAPPEGTTPSDGQVDQQELVEVVNELQGLGALDPAAHQALWENLQKTDPALWPQLTRSYQAALARQKALRGPAEGGPLEHVVAEQTLASSSLLAKGQSTPAAAAAHEPAPSTAGAPGTGARATAVTQPAGQSAQAPPISNAQTSPLIADSSVPPGEGLRPPASGPASSIQPGQVGPLAGASGQPQRSGVAPASFRVEGPPSDWRAALDASIRGLEGATRESPRSTDEISEHALLRLLYLSSGRRDDALKPISGLAPAQQDFWSQQLYALSVWMDDEQQPSLDRRAAKAVEYLDKARARLGEMATLRVRNLAFCEEVSSYGVIREFEPKEFSPGQQVILYAEIENFRSAQAPEGYHTSLKSSYQVLDSRGQRVAEHEFAVIEEYCRNPRRDYFISYNPIYIPERVYDGGRYTLQLTVEDTLSRKIGQASIDFTITPLP